MKVFLCTLLLILLSYNNAYAVSIARFIILIGQSEAGNYGTLNKPFPYTWTANDKIKIFNGATNLFETYAPNINSSGYGNTPVFGFEAEFARLWAIDHPNETLYIVKVWVGGCPLAKKPSNVCDFWPGHDGANKQWSVVWQTFVNAASALPYGKLGYLDALILSSGQTDAMLLDDANKFKNNAFFLSKSLKDRFWLFNSPTIIVRPSNTLSIAGPYLSIVRSGTEALAAHPKANTAYVDEDDQPEEATLPGHINNYGTIVVGSRIYNTWKSIFLP